MNTYSSAQRYGSTGNPLCDKLKREFQGRGAAAVMQQQSAHSASRSAHRAVSHLDPFEREVKKEKTVSYEELHRRVQPSAHRNSGVSASVTPRRTAQQTQEKRKKAIPTGSVVARNAASVESRRRKSAAAAAVRVREQAPVMEVKLTRAPFPFAAVTLLMIFTVMVMVIVFSFAQNYELGNEISMLEAQAEELAQQEKDLSIQLEKRDDIRVIEDVAVNQIGMVRGSLVESRFVSVSGGDRVELLNHAEADEKTQGGYSFFSNMLSAIGENLRDYLE